MNINRYFNTIDIGLDLVWLLQLCVHVVVYIVVAIVYKICITNDTHRIQWTSTHFDYLLRTQFTINLNRIWMYSVHCTHTLKCILKENIFFLEDLHTLIRAASNIKTSFIQASNLSIGFQEAPHPKLLFFLVKTGRKFKWKNIIQKKKTKLNEESKVRIQKLIISTLLNQQVFTPVIL